MADNGKTITYSDLSPQKRHVNTLDFFTLKLLWISLLCAVSFLLSATASFAKPEKTRFPQIALKFYRQTFHVTSEADSGPGSLRDILETMASDDSDGEARFRRETVIYFDVPGGVIKPKTPFPSVTSNTNFIGPVSFDMSETSEIYQDSILGGYPYMSTDELFYIAGVNSVFHNINFQNAQRIRPVYYEGGSGHFVDCNFSNNFTYAGGGAICQITVGNSVDGWGALAFTRCSFTENTAESGGGAIYSLGDLTLIDCMFENNVAGKYGIPSPRDLPAQRHRAGGAVYGHYINAIGCTFKNNQVVYAREKSEVSSDDVTIETSDSFINVWRLAISSGMGGLPDYYTGVSHVKETLTTYVILNIKNCTLIERK